MAMTPANLLRRNTTQNIARSLRQPPQPAPGGVWAGPPVQGGGWAGQFPPRLPPQQVQPWNYLDLMRSAGRSDSTSMPAPGTGGMPFGGGESGGNAGETGGGGSLPPPDLPPIGDAGGIPNGPPDFGNPQPPGGPIVEFPGPDPVQDYWTDPAGPTAPVPPRAEFIEGPPIPGDQPGPNISPGFMRAIQEMLANARNTRRMAHINSVSFGNNPNQGGAYGGGQGGYDQSQMNSRHVL